MFLAQLVAWIAVLGACLFMFTKSATELKVDEDSILSYLSHLIRNPLTLSNSVFNLKLETEKSMNKLEKKKKLEEYENFIDNTLKSDLKEIQTKLEERALDLKNWHDVKRVVKLYTWYNNNGKQDLTLYNRLISVPNREVLAKVQVKELSKIFVKIGCNCLLEMDLEEADKYANIRIKVIEKQINHFRQMAVQVKTNIKLVLLAMNELNPHYKSS